MINSSSARRRRAIQLLVPIVGLLVIGTAAACSEAQSADEPAAGILTTTPVQPSTSGLTCGSSSVDDTALVRYRTEALINAPLSTVWTLQSDVEGWPTWQKPVLDLTRNDSGPLREGSQFRWATPAPATPTTPATTLSITSTVHQVVPNECIRWSGPAVGEGLTIDNGVHVWDFTEVDDGTLVRTEESLTGAQVEADVPMATAALGGGLEAWLADLKTTAEATR